MQTPWKPDLQIRQCAHIKSHQAQHPKCSTVLANLYSVPTLTGESKSHLWEAALKRELDDINPELWRVITAERLPINAIPVQFSSEELLTRAVAQYNVTPEQVTDAQLNSYKPEFVDGPDQDYREWQTLNSVAMHLNSIAADESIRHLIHRQTFAFGSYNALAEEFSPGRARERLELVLHEPFPNFPRFPSLEFR
ncbi:unnamed protein product [Penicillium pancosmium]